MHSTVYTAMVRHGLVLHVRQQTPGRARCQPAKRKFSVGSFNEEHGEITVHHKDPSDDACFSQGSVSCSVSGWTCATQCSFAAVSSTSPATLGAVAASFCVVSLLSFVILFQVVLIGSPGDILPCFGVAICFNLSQHLVVNKAVALMQSWLVQKFLKCLTQQQVLMKFRKSF